VVNSFKRWLTDYYYEQEDAICLDSIQDFAASSEQNMLQQAVDKVRGQEPPMRYSTDPAPTPIMPRGTPNGLLDMDPVEIARQMTLLEFARFTDIKPIEFLNKGQQKHGAYPNLQANMDASNRIANWVSVTIMREKDDVKARVAIFTHWINVGICLYDQLQNYSSTAFIIAGLEVTSVRLTRTVDALPEKVLKDWNKLYNGGEWFARNYHKYHLSIKHKSGPLIPFLGPYITAVVFAEEGNKDKSQVSLAASDSSTPMTPAPSSASDATTANGDAAAAPALLINFTKRQISGDIIRDLKEYQHRKYNLAECLPISKFIETAIAAVTDEEKERYQIM
jgi:son of sevenless-like protein